MRAYDTVTNAFGETVHRPFLPYGGTCSGGIAAATFEHYPPSSTIGYVPEDTVVKTVVEVPQSNLYWLKRQQGKIVMNPYGVRTTSTQYFLASRDYRDSTWYRQGASCSSKCGSAWGPVKATRSWTQNDHIGSLSSVARLPLGNPGFESDMQDRIAQAISLTKQEAFAQAMSTYDVLTELAEAHQLVSLLMSKVEAASSILSNVKGRTSPMTFRRFRSRRAKSLLKSSDKELRAAGNRWLEARYAILPIVYSMEDIYDLIRQRHYIYKTSRSKRYFEDATDFVLPPHGVGIGTRISYKVLVRSTVKLGYNDNALRRMFSQTQFNSFRTAWELIPYSFVVDWFLNVGDLIASVSSIDLSSIRGCCTSVKHTRVEETFLLDYSTDHSVVSFPKTVCHPAQSLSEEHTRNVMALLKKETVQEYNRFLWHEPAPELHFDPYLTWQRILDGVALAYRPVRNILKGL